MSTKKDIVTRLSTPHNNPVSINGYKIFVYPPRYAGDFGLISVDKNGTEKKQIRYLNNGTIARDEAAQYIVNQQAAAESTHKKRLGNNLGVRLGVKAHMRNRRKLPVRNLERVNE